MHAVCALPALSARQKVEQCDVPGISKLRGIIAASRDAVAKFFFSLLDQYQANDGQALPRASILEMRSRSLELALGLAGALAQNGLVSSFEQLREAIRIDGENECKESLADGRGFLVAPVASVEDARLVLEAGADEIYCGVLTEDWKARYGDGDLVSRRQGSGAHLRSLEELASVAALARQRGRGAALTLNSRYTRGQERAVCLLRGLASVGVRYYKVAGRGYPGSMVARAVRFLRDALDQNNEHGIECLVRSRRIRDDYTRTFGRPCTPANCYYQQNPSAR